MDSLIDIPQRAIKTIYKVMLYVEIFLHVLGFIVSAAFLSNFSRLRSVHLNLRWIFASFVLSACITSIWRIYYCLLLLILDTDTNDDVLDLSSSMRKTCVYARLHLFLLAAERQIATARSRSYEDEHHAVLVCVTITALWGFSYLVVSCLISLETARDFVASFIFSAIYGISIALMTHVRKSNLARWKNNRGTLQFSQSYQLIITLRSRPLSYFFYDVYLTTMNSVAYTAVSVSSEPDKKAHVVVRENVKSATYLYKCFLVFSVQTIIGWFSLLVYLVFRKIFKVPILEKLFGFVFDVSVALLTTTIPMTIVVHNEKLKERFRMLRKRSKKTANKSGSWAELLEFPIVCSSKKPAKVMTVRTLVDLEGKRVNVETREESAAYFSQFKEAWS